MAEIKWHEGAVSAADRSKLLKQKGCTLWFTGLSGSGKSTVAAALEQTLIHNGHAAYRLDGDNIRFGLSFGLGFSAEDRAENIRRIGEVAKLFADAGLIAITSFISPYRKARDAVRKIHEQNKGGAIPFIEIHVATPIEICERRDPKGLYKQARAALMSGKGMGFTGVDDPYEPPLKPELTIDCSTKSTQDLVLEVVRYLEERGLLSG